MRDVKKEGKMGSSLAEVEKAVRSVRFTVWIYFAIFITSILVLIWVSFIVSLEATYRSRKTADITNLANYILTEWSGNGYGGKI